MKLFFKHHFKRLVLSLSLLVFSISNLHAQKWVDTLYNIKSTLDITYGTARDFAGKSTVLQFDLSLPTNDTVRPCGRPLLIMVHGGAWIAGDKAEGYSKRIREDFAKRGYATASVNYRLGQFHTDRKINCNVPMWNCYNMADSSEWYRANYRGIQDVRGAIRYLIAKADIYNIDPNNVFVVGESAGGFIAMGVGFLDDTSEVVKPFINSLDTLKAPNSIYEAPCIKTFNLATSISAMDLSRPSLGSHQGSLNSPNSNKYRIRAVGNFYGGAFNNIFETKGDTAPALFLFHQPNDLIVPYNFSKALAGYAACASGFPTNCGALINRPFVYGSFGIKKLIDSLHKNNKRAPQYSFNSTNNNAGCLQQASTPSLVGHAIDNYASRTLSMAQYFSRFIDTCSSVGIDEISFKKLNWNIYPNPNNGSFSIDFGTSIFEGSISILNSQGQLIQKISEIKSRKTEIRASLEPGIYFIEIQDVKMNKSINRILVN